ncbi:MAG: UDP-N-acetylmuramoyl-tripeptide--D-alanyl-D-alanine ligase [Caldilineaceae bacterium]
MRPVIATEITLHTLWQTLTGQIPPLALPATKISHAVLDNRDTTAGDLFIAFAGRHTDGHFFVGDALQRGAQAIVCEEQGRQQAQEHGAVLVDCTTGRWDTIATLPIAYHGQKALAFIVDNTTEALQKLGAFQRLHRGHPNLRVIGVTGSVGKTSTKELAAAVLQQRYRTLHNPGSLNSEQGLPFTLLGLSWQHERAILEMGMYDLGEISALCTLARPHIGIITNVGPSHLERLGTIERIAQAKAELVEALPSAAEGGVAILNWDDERVRPMAEKTRARVFRYGLSPEADLWADEIEGAGLEGIRFRFHYRRPGTPAVESVSVRVPLLGRHSVHTALRAAALGLIEGFNWEEIITGMQSIPGQIRLVVVPGINGSTVVDDTYNASPASTVAALNLLADLEPARQGRRVAVLGDMLELGHFTDEGHKLVGRRAADVVDLLVTVGDLGRAIGEEAQVAGLNPAAIEILPDHKDAIAYLRQHIGEDDLVLIKGSRAVGMDIIVAEIILTPQ